MRVIEKRRGYFHGTHKGATIEIERDPAPFDPERKFYIIVRWKDGGYLYQGWSPAGVNSMAEAKRDAIKGACLNSKRAGPIDEDLPYQCDACSTPGYGSDAPCRCTTI